MSKPETESLIAGLTGQGAANAALGCQGCRKCRCKSFYDGASAGGEAASSPLGDSLDRLLALPRREGGPRGAHLEHSSRRDTQR